MVETKIRQREDSFGLCCWRGGNCAIARKLWTCPSCRRAPNHGTCMQALFLLWLVIENHDNLFIMGETVHFIGIGVLLWKLLTKKNCGGWPCRASVLQNIAAWCRCHQPDISQMPCRAVIKITRAHCHIPCCQIILQVTFFQLSMRCLTIGCALSSQEQQGLSDVTLQQLAVSHRLSAPSLGDSEWF